MNKYNKIDNIMLQQEFEERTGLTLTAEEYSEVENLYYNLGNMTKDEFCAEFKAHGESVILKTILRNLKIYKNACKTLEADNKRLYALILKTNNAFAIRDAGTIIGMRNAIIEKLKANNPLTKDEKAYIEEKLY